MNQSELIDKVALLFPPPESQDELRNARRSRPANKRGRGGVQRLAVTAPEAARSPDRLDPVHLVGFGDRRKAQNLPGLLREDVANEIVFV